MSLQPTANTHMQLNSLRVQVVSDIEKLLKCSNSPSHQKLLCLLKNSELEKWSEIIDEYVNDDLDQLQQKLETIETAIYQMEQGMYGVCIECESAIEPELLLNDPCSQRCGACLKRSKEQN